MPLAEIRRSDLARVPLGESILTIDKPEHVPIVDDLPHVHVQRLLGDAADFPRTASHAAAADDGGQPDKCDQENKFSHKTPNLR